MNAQDLAPSVDPITRQYIELAIHEATTPILQAIEDLSSKLAQIKPADPNLSAIADAIRQPLIDEANMVIARLVSAKFGDLSQQLSILSGRIGTHIADVEYATESMTAKVDALNARLDKFAHGERYELTRAQVMKAMRENQKAKT